MKDNQEYYAHLKKDTEENKDIKEIKDPHLLEDHLKKVAKKAEDFIFNPVLKALINPAGKWHDLGKYRKKFQDYIRSVNEEERQNAHLEPAENSTNNKQKVAKTTHSMAGAVYAREKLGALGDVLAYIIAGHHAGLADGNGGNAKKSDLEYRLHNADTEYNESMIADIPNEILEVDTSIINQQAIVPFFQDKHACALAIRILFSALVDADFLDTEAYMLGKERQYNYDSIENLYTKYTNHMQGFSNNEQNTINKLRQQIQSDCLIKAELPSGIYSLTVPTGGGKTLASLGFALKHALKHNKRRIIYAIPFTSIIEQTVKVFKEILGEDNIIEHHSNLESTKETNSSRLATENWDAPIIVTTNVQLFESLHASRTSRCRKLHRLQDSIIILDEAQQLPRELHQPIVNSISTLATYFGVSWVLCTATQPVFTTTKIPGYENKTEFFGLNNVTEICENKAGLQKKLERVTVEFKPNKIANWEEIAEEILQNNIVLSIVNTRKDARELYNLIKQNAKENTYHLSAAMCAEHRSDVLKEIRKKLEEAKKNNGVLRVVSTQLIEAGIDIDFPVVYRAMAGLDSLAQSAGRCNREGKLANGKLVVFQPPKMSPIGFLKQAEQITTEMLNYGMLKDNPFTLTNFKWFFDRLNAIGNRDQYKITELLTPKFNPYSEKLNLNIKFRTAAKQFRMIDDKSLAVIVPYIPKNKSPVNEWLTTLENLEKNIKDDQNKNIAKDIYRKLQRYTVNIPGSKLAEYEQEGVISNKAGFWLVNEKNCNKEQNYYNDVGLKPTEALLKAENTII